MNLLSRPARSGRPGVDGCDDLAKGIGGDVRQRRAILDTIEDVKELGTELKLRACSTLSMAAAANPNAEQVT
jgi:hypothetical protein